MIRFKTNLSYLSAVFKFYKSVANEGNDYHYRIEDKKIEPVITDGTGSKMNASIMAT